VFSGKAYNNLLYIEGDKVSIPTISEKLFEQLCVNKDIVCNRIGETNAKTPDYRIVIGPMEIITEVKQLDPRPGDARHKELWGTPQSPGGFDATNRIQDKLEQGYPQVKRLSKGIFPTMIVIYNNAGEWNLLSNFAVSTAMFGDYGFVFESKPDQNIEVTRQGHLGKRKVTKDTYRSLSAVAVLKSTESGALELSCYHNPFAKVPIEAKSLAKLATNQYIKPNPHEGSYVDWQSIQIKI